MIGHDTGPHVKTVMLIALAISAAVSLVVFVVLLARGWHWGWASAAAWALFAALWLVGVVVLMQLVELFGG